MDSQLVPYSHSLLKEKFNLLPFISIAHYVCIVNSINIYSLLPKALALKGSRTFTWLFKTVLIFTFAMLRSDLIKDASPWAGTLIICIHKLELLCKQKNSWWKLLSSDPVRVLGLCEFSDWMEPLICSDKARESDRPRLRQLYYFPVLLLCTISFPESSLKWRTYCRSQNIAVCVA